MTLDFTDTEVVCSEVSGRYFEMRPKEGASEKPLCGMSSKTSFGETDSGVSSLESTSMPSSMDSDAGVSLSAEEELSLAGESHRR